MKSTRIALLVAVAVGFAGTAALRLALADDPAPVTLAEQARIKQLIENLGSDDFRIREAASKALQEFGAKAKPALLEAAQHESPEVRFRADQLLRKLEGQNRERPVGGDQPAPGSTEPSPRPFPWAGGHAGDDARKLMEEMEKRVREMERRMREAFGSEPFGPPSLRMPEFWRGLVQRRHFAADGAELTLGARTAKLTLPEPGGTRVTYEGANLDEILASHPELKDKPGVASLVEQVRKAREAEEAARTQPSPFGGHPGLSFRAQGVQIESSPGHVKVTVTEPGPDGKPVVKTYEGTDLESLKKEHPELAGKVGGIELHIGPRPEGWMPFGGGRLRGGRLLPVEPEDDDEEDGDDETDGDDDDELDADETGPFGLQIGPVDPTLRTHLGLAEGAGAIVRLVRPQSQAADLGILPLDVVTRVNDQPVNGPAGVADALRGVEKGTPLKVEVVRGGQPRILSR